MTTFDWIRYLSEAEEQRLLGTASLGPPARRLQIAEEIAAAALECEGVEITAAEILAAIERRQDELAVDSARKIIDEALAEQEARPVVHAPPPSYDRDGAGHRRPLKRGSQLSPSKIRLTSPQPTIEMSADFRHFFG